MCIAALVDELSRVGFDPAVADDADEVVVAFTRCPFAELAEANPQLVCNLHRGFVEGFVEDFAEVPRDAREDMVVLREFGRAALVKNTRPAPCSDK